MRRIGIIGAMEVEVEKLKARMENVEITHAGLPWNFMQELLKAKM